MKLFTITVLSNDGNYASIDAIHSFTEHGNAVRKFRELVDNARKENSFDQENLKDDVRYSQLSESSTEYSSLVIELKETETEDLQEETRKEKVVGAISDLKEEYGKSDVCIAELLADLEVPEGMTYEEAFGIYVKMLSEIEGDAFYRHVENDVTLYVPTEDGVTEKNQRTRSYIILAKKDDIIDMAEKFEAVCRFPDVEEEKVEEAAAAFDRHAKGDDYAFAVFEFRTEAEKRAFENGVNEGITWLTNYPVAKKYALLTETFRKADKKPYTFDE